MMLKVKSMSVGNGRERSMSKLNAVMLAAVALALFIACGCSDTIDEPDDGFGDATMVLTDAAADEIAVFEVDVTQLSLTKWNGAVVNTLPRRQRVDFAQLRDISQLLVGVRLPAGFYRDVTLTLDFSEALVLLKDSSTPATVYDADGNILSGAIDVQVLFGENERPQIIIRRNRLFVFDLNLDASVKADPGANTVTFTPIITAQVDPTNPKPVTTTGKLVSADTATGDIVLSVHNPRTGEEVGRYTVETGPLSVFHVDGVPSFRAAGITALAAKPEGTRVFAHGVVDAERRVLRAAFVEAGAGVPGSGQDWCKGLIVARSGGAGADATLTLRGCTYTEASHTWSFNQTITVQVSFSDTVVIRRGSWFARTADELNVGQRITVYGDLAGNVMDATGTAQGVIRCIRTDIYGFAAGPAAAGALEIDLCRIGLRHIANFDFTVEGTPQADPGAFALDIGTLNPSTVTAGTPVRVRGFIAPVGAAPADADFAAEMVIDRSAVASLLICEWLPESASAISSATGTELTLDLTGSVYSKVDYGFVGMVDLNPSPSPQIVPKYGLGLYVISQNGVNEVYLTFSGFSTALSDRLGPTSRVFQIFALGSYDPGTQTLSCSSTVVVLK